MRIVTKPSHLQFDAHGEVPVRLMQAAAEKKLLGIRGALANAQKIEVEAVTDAQVVEFNRRLDFTRSDELAVLSFHPGVSAHHEKLKQLSLSRTLVTLGGVDSDNHIVTLIADDGELISQAKLSLASEDQDAGIGRGDTLHVFEAHHAGDVRWAVLNCHDYTHAHLLVELQKQQLDLLVIVAYNPATRLFWEYAVSDVHRLFCYIVIVNVGELGGSGVFVPFRRVGLEATAKFGASGQIFGTRGPGDTNTLVKLNIERLRKRRADFSEKGLRAFPELEKASDVDFMVPSQHYMDTIDRPAGPPKTGPVEVIPTPWQSIKPVVAIAQLKSMPVKAYRQSRYRLRDAQGYAAFIGKLEYRLAALKDELRANHDGKLDFLVFPEVLVPRDFAEKQLADFAREFGTIVIAGVDYPGERDEDNRNSCAILHPTDKPQWYDKVTRSQYDAQQASGDGRMPMARGDRLLRFENAEGHSFGVLICYDFSHLDLVSRINTDSGRKPLDILFVVAHNPYATLYRASCIADSHRFYQHIVMCNVADYGGSGVFLPERTKGLRQTQLEIGLNTEAIAVTTLDLAKVRAARQQADNKLHDKTMIRKPGIFQWHQP